MQVEEIAKDIFCLQSPVFSIYLVRGEKTALLELGISQIIPEIIYDLENFLGVKEIDYLISLHSHFDHLGGVTRLRKRFSQALLVASPITSEVFSSPATIRLYQRTMEKINDNPLFKMVFPRSDDKVLFEKPKVDIPTREDLVLNLGQDKSLRVLNTPGHTACSISVLEDGSRALFVSDSTGAPLPSGKIWPTAFYSFTEYKDSISKIRALNPKVIGLGHTGKIKGEEVDKYLEKSLKETDKFIEHLKELCLSLGDEEVHRRLFAEYGDDLTTYIQPNIFKYGNKEMLKQVHGVD
ncbi:MAG: hypothetical protein COS84_09250 [Armatimonadetes bacterium CG07_land_8_20_14_0_80_40_9]|nr:MAG: hypothetical protein COS84_09250 [Armatimonadetes bacterium CG07_land_8_20_14_0_80_40_9]